uniref:Calponin-1 n=1 Tax=Mastacembelus armatus TaxID=205130 RepID=A0A3Q3M0A4_9TELE
MFRTEGWCMETLSLCSKPEYKAKVKSWRLFSTAGREVRPAEGGGAEAVDSGCDWEEDRGQLHGGSEGWGAAVRVSVRHCFMVSPALSCDLTSAEFCVSRLINVLQPGSVRKINHSSQNWHQLENIGNFVRAITEYGLKPHDIFEANDLFENVNHTQVQCTLIALAGMAKSKGFCSKYDLGVKYAEKQQRRFAPEKLREGRNIIGLQMGTNKLASQKGMTSYGTRRHLYDAKMGMDNPLDQSTISLQMGTNKGASQSGMTAPGTRRHIFDKKLELENCDTSTISLQMGTNKVASQQGMTTYGLPRQVYDNKYCTNPTEIYYNNGSEVEFDGYNQYSD